MGAGAPDEGERDELDRTATPASVRMWIAPPPPWLSVAPGADTDTDAALAALDPGEQAAIALAVVLGAELILMNERIGVPAARCEASR